MKHIYKYGFWVLLLCLITFFNYLNITRKGLIKDKENILNVYSQRVSSLLFSNNIIKRNINEIVGFEIKKNIKQLIQLKENLFIILLSDFKCNKCQENELRRLNKINQSKKNNTKVIGITTLEMKNQVSIQKNILDITFPIYWVDDTTFSEISVSNDYPQIIYVKDKIIHSAFIPIPLDDEFSEMYYEEFLKSIVKKPNPKFSLPN